jgi:hypothetical protein
MGASGDTFKIRNSGATATRIDQLLESVSAIFAFRINFTPLGKLYGL